MKKVTFSVLLLALILLSCGNDDDNSNSEASIEGTWKLSSWSAEEAVDLNNDGVAHLNLLDEMNCYANETIVFTSNTATYNGTSYADITFDLETGSSNQYNYTINCIEENSSQQGTYVKNGNTVVITFEGDNTVATVSGNQLTFLVPEGYYTESSNNPNVTVEQDLTLVFTKQ